VHAQALVQDGRQRRTGRRCRGGLGELAQVRHEDGQEPQVTDLLGRLLAAQEALDLLIAELV
jgi:hypothetical protein